MKLKYICIVAALLNASQGMQINMYENDQTSSPKHYIKSVKKPHSQKLSANGTNSTQDNTSSVSNVTANNTPAVNATSANATSANVTASNSTVANTSASNATSANSNVTNTTSANKTGGINPNGQTPVVIFGGMGSTCTDPSYVNLMNILEQNYQPKAMECYHTLTLESIKLQADKACQYVINHPVLKDQPELNVIGISQGGLVGRSFVEQCTGFHGKVRNLLTIGTPNMGIASIPKTGCEKEFEGPSASIICKVQPEVLDNLVFSDAIQHSVAAAGYYRNPDHLDNYIKKSPFLAVLNNEQQTDKFEDQKQRMKNLTGFMMVEFDQDTIVSPPASEVFGEFSKTENGNQKVVAMENTNLYKNDYLGLKTLDQQGKLKQIHIDAGHTQFKDADILNTFIPFLKQ